MPHKKKSCLGITVICGHTFFASSSKNFLKGPTNFEVLAMKALNLKKIEKIQKQDYLNLYIFKLLMVCTGLSSEKFYVRDLW